MKTITLRVTADDDGVLTVAVPTGTANTEYEMVVVLQPTAPEIAEAGDVPPPGTAARMLYEAQKANIHLGEGIDASLTDDILNDEFADYLLKGMPDNDAAE
jgi:hypothetical protein